MSQNQDHISKGWAKRSINFECDIECGGKCCHGATHLLASEFKGLMGEAPIIPMLIVMRQKAIPKPFANKLKPHAIEIKVKMSEKSNTSERFYVFLDFTLGTLKSKKSCILLKDGLCSVHDKKPLKCKLLPIHPLIPESWMGFGIDKMKTTECTGFKDPKEKEFEIFKNGSLSRLGDKAMVEEYLKELGNHREFLNAIFQVEEELKEDGIENGVGVTRLLDGLIDMCISDTDGAQQRTGEFTFPVFSADLFKILTEDVSLEDFMVAQLSAYKKFEEYDREGWEKTKTLNLQKILMENELSQLGTKAVTTI